MVTDTRKSKISKNMQFSDITNFTWMALTRYPDKMDTHTVKIASQPIASH